MVIKLFKPYVSWKAIRNVVRVLRSGHLNSGPEVLKFEYEFGKKFGLNNVLALNSGTSALELAYELADIRPGDEVITTVLTCTATNIPLARIKAKIVFADIDLDLNINIHDVKEKITKKTKAIVFVHFGGNNRGLTELLSLCKDRGIVLIEDAAQAVGSDNWGKADFTCVSLQAIKTLTAGDGGFLICKSAKDYEKAKRLRWYGFDYRSTQAGLSVAGYKMEMNDVTAAIGRGNLADIDKILAHKRKLAAIYKKYGIEGHAWLALGYVKRLPPNFVEFETGQHHYRNDKYELFGGKRLNLPIMNQLECSYIFFPYHYYVTEKQAHLIGKTYEIYQSQDR